MNNDKLNKFDGDEQAFAEVQDKMSLAEHDLRYHDNHYKEGDECLYRERLASGDDSDAALEEANQIESNLYFARRQELESIRYTLTNNFLKEFSRKNKLRTNILPPDKNGNSEIHIWGTSANPDELFTEEKMKDAVKSMGYKMVGFRIMKRKGENDDKKVWVIKMHTNRKLGQTAKQNKEDAATVRTAPTSELSDEQRSANLKRYGYKVENGKTIRRDGSEKKSAAQKYLDLVKGGEFCLANQPGNEQMKRMKLGEEEERRQFMRELGLDV